MNAEPKSVVGHRRHTPRDLCHRLSVSITPAHKQTLDQRVRELNIGPSSIIQLFLDIEQSDGIIRTELLKRLRRPRINNNPQTESNLDCKTNDQLAHL